MDKVLVWAFLHLLLGCQGLKLTLEKKAPSLLYSRATCGVLLCVEESHTVTNATRDDLDPNDPLSQAATISSLKVFKLDATFTNTNSGGKRRSLLASVTSQQSRLTRVSNGVKVDGRLETGRATLRLEFTKQEDCRSEYICQTRGVDPEGRELVSTSHIMQQTGDSNDQRDDLSWTPGSAMQVMSLVQQLEAKLADVATAVGSWEDEMSSLKETARHDVESLKRDLNTKADRLEDKMLYFGKDLDTQTDRLEDKIESLQTDLNRKASHLEDKAEALNTRLEDKIDSFANHLEAEKAGQSDSCEIRLSDIIETGIKTEIISLDAKMSTIKDEVAHIGTDVDVNFSKINQKLQVLEENGEQLFINFNNLTRSSQSEPCEGSRDFVRVVSEGFDSLEQNIEEKFLDISLNMKTTASETRSFLESQSSQGNITVGEELKSVLTDLLKPKDCYKGMASSTSLASSPYTEIQPSKENSLTAPVLCDTFTDGGGWIVFQRRVTGDVNFYRGWADYKQGFGSLNGDFWLGLDNIHAITSTGVFELRVDMIYNGNFAFAHYDSFSVGDEKSNYVLRVAHYDGTAGESLIEKHNGMPFSTHDKDNDEWSSHCAVEYAGAWWYKSCHLANLNGQWTAGNNRGPRWSTLSGTHALSYTEMKVRRVT